MKRVALVRRQPDQIDVYERQAAASQLGVNTSEIQFSFIDAGTSEAYIIGLELYRPDLVLVHDKGDWELVRKAVEQEHPHFAFMPDRNGDGSDMGRRLFKLLPSGKFVTKW